MIPPPDIMRPGQLDGMIDSMKSVNIISAFVFTMSLVAALAVPVGAERYTSPNYTIDASVGNSFGGAASSTNYKMVSSGGESIIGNGAGGSYKLGQGYIAQTEQSIELRLQPSSLVAYYPLDESSGTAAQDVGLSSLNAKLYNSPSWVAGKIGNGLQTDGVSQYAEIPNNAALDVAPGQARTISAWIKAGVQSQQTYFLWKQNNCIGWAFFINTTGNVGVDMSTGDTTCTGYVGTTATAWDKRYDDNAWHYVTAVIDRGAGAMNLYVDGVLKDTKTVPTATSASGGGPLKIGTNWNNAQGFNGVIDEPKIFSRAFTASEVANDYTAGSAGVPSSVTLPSITPGASQTAGLSAYVQTDAPAYGMSVMQDHDLQKGADTIPAITGGTIASPTAWSEGVTKGLGFTLTAGNALPVKWGTSPNYNYAALPGVNTTFYNRSGFTGGAKDKLDMQFRLDVASTQPSGSYQNNVSYTATLIP